MSTHDDRWADVDRLMREAAEEAAQAKIHAILNAEPTLSETTETYEFTITPVTYDGVRYTRVRVSRTRFLQPDDEGREDDYLEVRAYGQKTTRKGTVNKRDTPFWHSMPDRLAGPLIRHAARQAKEHENRN